MTKTPANYVWAESMASETLDTFNVADAPVPVETIAEKLGLNVYLAGFPDDDIAGYIQFDANDWKVVVNRAHPPNRRAFTIAHECGHFLLHKDLLKNDPDVGVLYRRPIVGESDPIEQEANCFAANLLVPERLLQRYYDYQPDSQMARLFGVSEEVIAYRLKSTGRR